MAAGVTGSIGLAAAVVPEVWMRPFSAEAAVVAGFAQLVIAGGGGWVVVHVLCWEVAALFAVLALVVYGVTVAEAIRAGP